jgi:hypothetical protein
MRQNEKGKRFEELIERADNALEKGFFIECITLYYAFIEERMISLLERLGYTLNRRKKLHYCINQLKELGLDGFFSTSLLDDLDIWRNERNDMIHDYAKESVEYDSLQQTAENGKKLGRELAAAIMRHKKSLNNS